jgi:purine-binding chemotaxis protein CheW
VAGDAPRRILLVRVGGESFGLPVADIGEIVPVTGISRVEKAPFSVRGSVNLRGVAVVVVDLGLRLGLGAVDIIDSRLVVVRSRGRRIALLVDAVEQLLRVDPGSIEPLPEAARAPSSSCVRGVLQHGSGLVLLLDVERTLVVDGDSPTGEEKCDGR